MSGEWTVWLTELNRRVQAATSIASPSACCVCFLDFQLEGTGSQPSRVPSHPSLRACLPLLYALQIVGRRLANSSSFSSHGLFLPRQVSAAGGGAAAAEISGCPLWETGGHPGCGGADNLGEWQVVLCFGTECVLNQLD